MSSRASTPRSAAYLAAMGVGDPVMTLMRKTPAASVRWLSLADLKASRLATLALDAAEPILTSGANGLNGRAFDGDPPRADLMQASLDRTSPAGRRQWRDARDRVPLSPRRRRGRSGNDGARCGHARGRRCAVSGWSLGLTRAPAANRLQLTAHRNAGACAIPRERFCALASGGALVEPRPRGQASGGLSAHAALRALANRSGTRRLRRGLPLA